MYKAVWKYALDKYIKGIAKKIILMSDFDYIFCFFN